MKRMMKRMATVLTVIVMAVALLGCPKPEIRDPEGQMDTPEHHVTVAERFVAKGDWKAAHREYQLALSLDPKHVPALIGEMLYFAQAGDSANTEKMRKAAFVNAKSSDERFEYYVGMIRYEGFMGGKKWLKRAEDNFESARKIKDTDDKLYYYMGGAYKKSLMFSQAESMYRKVIDMNGKFREEADNEWKLVQKIVRARPGTPMGMKIALVREITKADVAALFVEEMHLPELWEKRGIKTWETPEFRPPGAAPIAKGDVAADIGNHALRSDIEACLELGIRGLEVSPDGNFYPNKKISRAEYAVMLEDILIKVMNEPELATRYAGESKSKFHDMRTDHWSYNAAVVVTSRQIMPSNMEGKFYPARTVAGADALLVIRQMMDYLKIG